MGRVGGYSVLDASYQALLREVTALDDATGWCSSRCAGLDVAGEGLPRRPV
ncbi:MAG TPA: hypothetical protein VFJ14_09040 [Nocardioidaceae bacterium]|nr:hypothetical protein [Nocardioidaceae bacterium]